MLETPPAPVVDDQWIPDDDEPRARLSFFRVLLALALFVGVVGGTGLVVRAHLVGSSASTTPTWFAPYVDATLTPTYSFQTPTSNPAEQVVLGFVVSAPNAACTPSWGAVATLPEADQKFAIGARIAELTQEGARALVSFGGRDHKDLAVACTDVNALAKAYETVIENYRLRAIDLDVEGPALDDVTTVKRRATAIRMVQDWATQNHRQLSVWLTLPVDTSGLQGNGLSVIDSMLRDRVDLAGLNVMTMDFSTVPTTSSGMLDDVEHATTASQRQFADIERSYGVDSQTATSWQRIGVTVMIGQNDVAGERFTVDNAQGLVGFAKQVGLGRVSMWSLNRDHQCGSSFAQVGLQSNTCSGTVQGQLAFAHLFSQFNQVATGPEASAAPPTPDTNPADAPYPLWAPNASYQTGYKIVREGYIYQAKWYNAAQDPATQFQYAWETPWELLGPVLPGMHAQTPPTLPPGTYPTWSTSKSYVAGDRVMLNGLAYQAKWANLAASPTDALADPGGSPWQSLTAIPGEPSSN
jgi:chitinase